MLAGLLEILVAAFALALVVPAGTLFVQVLASLPAYRPRPAPSVPRPRVAVLVPAHDEALVIGATLESLRRQLQPGDRLLVVADNCTDATTAVAAQAGAEVIERREPARRGKGYALDFGVRHLAAAPPEVVVLIDADCQLAPGGLELLALACAAKARPVQCLDLMRCLTHSGFKARLSEFAWLVRNHVRPLGFLRLGLPCQLMGTGMAFPWPLITATPLATGHITEDLKLGIELARRGHAPRFLPEVTVASEFPADGQAAAVQRTRWEHGHLDVMREALPPLLLDGIRKRSLELLALAADLSVPPLSLLAAASLVAAAAGAGVAALSGGVFLLACLPLVLLVASVVLAWLRFARGTVAFETLARAPLYALAKLAIYAGYVKARQSEWVRSKRDQA